MRYCSSQFTLACDKHLLVKVRSEAVGYVVINVLFTGVFLSFDLIVFNFEFRFYPPSVFVVEFNYDSTVLEFQDRFSIVVTQLI